MKKAGRTILVIAGLVLIVFGTSKMFSMDDASGSPYVLIGVFIISFLLKRKYL